MRKGGTALACLVCALALAGTAAADLRVGVNDDGGKYESGGAWFYPTMAATGLRVNAITLRWDELSPTAIADQPLIEQAIARAQASGVAVELDIYPLHSQALTNGAAARRRPNPEACGNTARIQQFAAWAASVARTFPSVREFVVMNECNQPLFVNPQWDTSGQNQSAAICGRALAAAYDALKGVSGGDPRVGRRPLAARQRQAGRGDELLDDAGHVPRRARHVVPRVREEDRPHGAADGRPRLPPVPGAAVAAVRDGLRATQRSASVTNLPRIYQAFYDAFNGTPQRTIGQQKGGGLPVSLNETGVQTDTSGKPGLHRHRDLGDLGRRRRSTSSRPRATRRPGTGRCSTSSPATRTSPSSTSSTSSTRRTSPAGRAGSTSPTRRPKQSATGRPRLDRADRRPLPGQERHSGRSRCSTPAPATAVQTTTKPAKPAKVKPVKVKPVKAKPAKRQERLDVRTSVR